MHTLAVVFEGPERLTLSRTELMPPGEADLVVDVEYSGISTGTERLLWSGRMPHFPGMGYPLVPGYETIGRIARAGPYSGRRVGERVFVPGARCYTAVRGLFGGAAADLVVPAERATVIPDSLGAEGVLLALAATAYHALSSKPDLIVGHGALGRLLARLAVRMDGELPVVWEKNPTRAAAGTEYKVVHPDEDERRDYHSIYDVSGDATVLDTLIGRLAPGGNIVLAGFYDQRLSFAFPPAFMREASIHVAAQWLPRDLEAVKELVTSGELSLDGLITHTRPANEAEAAYRVAFNDPQCLKMILDWRACA
jgi:bacteriochlorophyllide a dehydrogenase